MGLVVLFLWDSYGQDTKPKPKLPADAKVDEVLVAQQLQKRNEQEFAQQAVEGVIDPAEYVVGPGDVLKLNFRGPSPEDLGVSITVTPEGKIIIPAVGVVEAHDKTLQQVQAETRQICATKYDPRNVEVSLHLTRLRSVRVYVFGEVNDDGVYTGSAIDRVSYYVSAAKSFTEWADDRHVQVRHLNG